MALPQSRSALLQALLHLPEPAPLSVATATTYAQARGKLIADLQQALSDGPTLSEVEQVQLELVQQQGVRVAAAAAQAREDVVGQLAALQSAGHKRGGPRHSAPTGGLINSVG